MPKGKEKAVVAGSSKSAIRDSSTIDISSSSSQTFARLKKLKVEQINRYKSLTKKPLREQVAESIRLKNIVKIALLSFASVGNVLLINHNPIITYIFASITCIAPAMYDYKKNYSLLNETVFKNDRDKNLKKKLEKVIKLTLPGSIGVLIGGVLIGIHISGVGGEIVRDVLLGVATFLAGGGQMLVNPLIRKEVARINLNKLQKKKINNPEVYALLEKEVKPEQAVNRMEEIDEAEEARMKAVLTEFTKMFTQASVLREQMENENRVNRENRSRELNAFATVIEIKNLENEDLRMHNTEAEKAINELVIKTEQEKIQFEQEKDQLRKEFEAKMQEKDSIILKMDGKIKTLEKKQQNYDLEAQASSHVSNLQKESRRISRGK